MAYIVASDRVENTEAVHSKKARKTVITNKIQAAIRFLVAAG